MGKNWMSPAVQAESGRVFGMFCMFLTGVVVWDFLSTLWFEWQFITRKRKFRWPLIIYEVARIALVLHIFAITINRNALWEVRCNKLIFLSKFGDAVATCAASFILLLRTRAVWHKNVVVTCCLAVLQVTQIVVWGQTFRYSVATWNEERKSCVISSTVPRPLAIGVWGFTMGYDLVILLLCLYRLSAHKNSTLGNILLRDGIAYFCAVFAANLCQTIMAGLQLNPSMNVMTLPFAAVVSVLAATMVFRNVFTAYDSFADRTLDPKRGTGAGKESTLRTGARILFNGNTTTVQTVQTTGEIPMGDYKAPDSSTIAVHKVVDVEVQGAAAAQQRDEEKAW